MTPPEVLAAVGYVGARLYLKDGTIRAVGARLLSDGIKAAIREHKSALLDLLAEAPQPRCEADTDPNLLLMVRCLERWPDRAAQWRDVDWANPVEVAVRVFGARITRVEAAS